MSSKKIFSNPLTISSVLAAVILVGSAYAAWDQLRPYPTIAEHEQVAAMSCEAWISWLSSEIRDIERRIQDAKDKKNYAHVRTLQEQLVDVKEKIKREKRKCGFG